MDMIQKNHEIWGTCRDCGGTREVKEYYKCSPCNGNGYLDNKREIPCQSCKSSGKSTNYKMVPCYNCGGTGQVRDNWASAQAQLTDHYSKGLGIFGAVAGVTAVSMAGVAIYMIKFPNSPVSQKLRQILHSNNIPVETFLLRYVPDGMKDKVSAAFGEGAAPASFCYNCGRTYENAVEKCEECGEPIGKAVCFECGAQAEWGNRFCPVCKKKLIFKTRKQVEEEKQAIESIKLYLQKDVAGDLIADLISDTLMFVNKKDGIYTFAGIPMETLSAAVKKFALIKNDEKILAFYDAQASGTGIVFTDKKVYWMNPGEQNGNALCYSEIADVECVKGTTLTNSIIKINKTNKIAMRHPKAFDGVSDFFKQCLRTGPIPSKQARVEATKNAVQAPKVAQNRKFCSECGNPIDNLSAKFCMSCGFKLS